jgi:hypothetical protein
MTTIAAFACFGVIIALLIPVSLDAITNLQIKLAIIEDSRSSFTLGETVNDQAKTMAEDQDFANNANTYDACIKRNFVSAEECARLYK